MSKPLSSKSYKLLINITSHHSLFDKHDNCFQASNRRIATSLNLSSKTTVDRLMQSLARLGLTAEVIDIHGVKRTMLCPHFYWVWHPLEKPFALAMFQLGSDAAAVAWRQDCLAVRHFTHPLTGELLAPYPYIELNNYRQGYTAKDRTKFKGHEIPDTKALQTHYYDDFYPDSSDSAVITECVATHSPIVIANSHYLSHESAIIGLGLNLYAAT